jgi:hypothetical protein
MILERRIRFLLCLSLLFLLLFFFGCLGQTREGDPIPATSFITETTNPSQQQLTVPASIIEANNIYPTPTATEKVRQRGIVSPTGSAPKLLLTSTKSPMEREPYLPTPMPVPTLLLIPPDPSREYELVEWTPERAVQLIEILSNYPETLSLAQLGRYDSGYFYAYRFAQLAQSEAFFRFPDFSESKNWAWSSAFNRIQSYAEDIGFPYAQFITKSLNDGETNLHDLETWFETKEPRLDLEITPLEPLPRYKSSQIVLIKLKEGYLLGGTYLWVLQKDANFTIYLLGGKSDYYLLDGETDLSLIDITGDGIAEAIIRHVDWQSFNMHSGTLEIYNLSSEPPVPLVLEPSPPDIEVANLAPTVENRWHLGISLQIPIGLESSIGCGQFGPTWDYRWNGVSFDLIGIHLPAEEAMLQNPRCADYLIAFYLPWIAKNFYEGAAYTLKGGLEQYPLSSEETLTIGALAPSKEFLHFELGLIFAYHGYSAEAIREWEFILSHPGNEWEETARKAIHAFRSNQDMLKLCLAVKECSRFLTVQDIIQFIPPKKIAEVTNLFEQMGFDILQTGMYDFDQDKTNEYWMLWRDKYSRNLLTNFVSKERVVEVQNLGEIYLENDPGPVVISLLSSEGSIYSYEVSVGNNEEEKLKIMIGASGAELPIKPWYATPLLWKIETSFFYGDGSLDIFFDNLTALHNQGIDCSDYPNLNRCDPQIRLEYLAALAHELRGNQQEAVDRYYSIWEAYPDSPYAIMAAGKLEVVP